MKTCSLPGPLVFNDSVSLMHGEDGSASVARYEMLIGAALSLSTERDLGALLDRLVRCAAEVVGTRYSALGTYDATGRVERFHHHGVDPVTARNIGHPPSGRGLLGTVMAAPGPVRLGELGDHAASCGLPPHHPPMHTFLGVPVRIGARRFGSLYLTEKLDGGAFDATDERLLETLATLAATAIESALLVAAEHERATTHTALAAAEERASSRASMLSLVIGAQEAERARVARDLHDQIGQALTSVLLALRLVNDSLDDELPDLRVVKERMTDVRSLVADALTDVRQLAFDLRPTVLDDVGLVPAVTRLTGDLQRRHGIAVILSVEGLADDSRFEPDVETVVYRVVQEALTNVVRHAEARTATVCVGHVGPFLRASVADDGVGFHVPELPTQSLGLAGMTERAQLVGGALRIASAPGHGTVVELEIPDG